MTPRIISSYYNRRGRWIPNQIQFGPEAGLEWRKKAGFETKPAFSS